MPSEVEPEDSAVHCVVAELPGEVSPEEDRPIDDPWRWLEPGETMGETMGETLGETMGETW